MPIQHQDITDPKIHEPKGASTAAINTVYVSDGSGSGVWQIVGFESLDTTDLYADVQDLIDAGTLTIPSKVYLTTQIDDVSTPSGVIIPLIKDCTVVSASYVLGGAIATADATVSLKNSAGALMAPAATIAFSGSAKGNTFANTCNANNVLVGPTWIEVVTDGAPDNVVPLYITIELLITANN